VAVDSLDDDLVLAELLEVAQLEGVTGAVPVVAVKLVELVGHILAAEQARDTDLDEFTKWIVAPEVPELVVF
jgi:hypothetical protein